MRIKFINEKIKLKIVFLSHEKFLNRFEILKLRNSFHLFHNHMTMVKQTVGVSLCLCLLFPNKVYHSIASDVVDKARVF